MPATVEAGTLKPLRDRVVVEPLEAEEKTASGIVLPDTAKEKPQQGKVIAVGSGKLTDDGKTVPMSVKVGDTVLFARYGGTEVKIGGAKLMIMNESDILAIVG
ncbi:MAG TPA: co-chaperone GroES [Limnochordia bacterium]|nr:co-chaperone GroES [Limnochordia bacterium]